MLIGNYFRIALRSLGRNRGYSAINILGLSTGIICCLLITAYVRHELSYDKYHANSDRVVRIALDATLGETSLQSAMSAVPLASAIQSEIPEVESAARLWRDRSGAMTVYTAEKQFREERVVYADANVFDVLTIPLVKGNQQTALQEPYSVVISEEVARKYFGEQDPIGKTIEFREPSDRDVFTYSVTGVMKNIPEASHLDMDFLASYITQRWSTSESWLGFGVYTYALLSERAAASTVEAKLEDVVRRYAGPQVVEEYGIEYDAYLASGQGYRYFIQPVEKIHLYSSLDDEFKPNSSARYVWVYSAIAIFIMLIAGINFVNLSTARAVERAKEVGVRKSLGAIKRQLVGQFVSESLVLSLLSTVLAVVMLSIAVPLFESMTGVDLAMHIGSYKTPIAIALFGGAIGIAAGLYPALYLARFRPALVVKGMTDLKGRRSGLRNALVVFQFAVSIALIAATTVVYKQMAYLGDRDLGFDTAEVLVLEGAEVLGNQGEAFREALRQLPGVDRVTNSEVVPGRSFGGAMFRVEGQSERAVTALNYTYTSFDFIETLGMELVAGRSLDRNRSTDSLAVVLNETAVAHLNIDNPIGKNLIWDGESTYTIVGVVKDFHITSLHHPVVPVALLGPDPRNTNRPNLLVSARVQTDRLGRTITEIEDTWSVYAPDQPFEYSFLDRDFERMYIKEVRTGRIVAASSILAILVASIGLFGLAAYSVSRRTKEIGIRKVLGASIVGIFTTLSRGFLGLVGVGLLLAIPVTYISMRFWLESFAYSTNIGWQPIFVGGLITLGVALMTISYQAFKAAIQNPVVSLKYE